MNEDEQRQRYENRVGWHGDIPEGHYAIPDPHEAGKVTTWRVKGGKLTPWPKQARSGPARVGGDGRLRAWPADIPKEAVAAAAFWADLRVAHGAYVEQVRGILTAAPQRHAARYASITFKCSLCNRPLKVAESNAYGVGPECRSWMPDALLARYADAVAQVRTEAELEAAVTSP